MALGQMSDTALLGMEGLITSLGTREVEADNRLKVILCYMGSLSLVCTRDFDSNNKATNTSLHPAATIKIKILILCVCPYFIFREDDTYLTVY